MSSIDSHVVRGWEERVICGEKGRRIVHFFLRDSTGSYLLVVIGVERSRNHIIYSPTWDYLRAFGSTNRVHVGTRWHSRKMVIKFLKSVTSGGGSLFDDSNQERMESQNLKHILFLMTRFSQRRTPVAEQKQETATNSEIVWLGDAWICSKQLKHYSAFCRNETRISVNSVVWILGRGGKDYLGYVEDMYETLQEEKMVRARTFLFQKDINHLRPDLLAESREVFITPTEEQLSAKDIDGLASVLAPDDFKECNEYLPLSLSFKNFMCCREVRNNGISTFSLSELRGYSAQPVLSSLKYYRQIASEEGADLGPQKKETKTYKRIKKFGVDQNALDLAKDGEAARPGPTHQCLKIKPADKEPVQNKLMIEARTRILPNVNESIELLSQDSGMRGCWLRCKILRTSKKLMKVQYCDVTDVSGPGKLEEWVVGGREAAKDRLGLRCSGRRTVRPWPSWDSSDATYEVGAAVDAWWCHGWWEGVVIGFDTCAKSNLQVYFPGENKFMSVERRNVRVSKDWINKEWVDIKPKHDILSVLTSWLNPAPKVSLPLPVSTGSPTAESSKEEAFRCHKE